MDYKKASELESYVKTITHSGVFASMITETSIDRGISKKTGKHLLGRIIKKSVVSDVYLYEGAYEDLVNSRREKNGLDRDFVAEPPKGMHHVDGHDLLLQSDHNPDQWYLRTYFPKNAKTRATVQYLLDGQPIDLREYEEFLTPSYFKDEVLHEKKEPEIKPENSQGLPDNKKVELRGYKLEGVKKLKIGQFQFAE